MATLNDVNRSAGRCCGCTHKTCIRIMGILGVILAIVQIVLSSTQIQALDHYDFSQHKDENERALARLAVPMFRGIFVALLVFGAIDLLCHLSLLMGNETKREGFFCPWAVACGIELPALAFLTFSSIKAGSTKDTLFMFIMFCIKVAFLISILKRLKEIKAENVVQVAVVDQPPMGIQQNVPVVGTSTQAGCVQFGAPMPGNQAVPAQAVSFMPNSQAGFVQSGPDTTANQGGIVHFYSSMAQNQGGFVPMGAPMARNEAGFVPIGNYTPSYQAASPQPVVSTMNKADETCPQSCPQQEPPPPYPKLGSI